MASLFNELLHGEPGNVADILSGDNPPELTGPELQALLTNILRRIDHIELQILDINYPVNR